MPNYASKRRCWQKKMLAEEDAADVERFEMYRKAKQAEAAQEWEDWAFFSEMNPEKAASASRKRLCLRVMVQQHDAQGNVEHKQTFQLPVDEGNTIPLRWVSSWQRLRPALGLPEPRDGAEKPEGRPDRPAGPDGHVSSFASRTEEFVPSVQHQGQGFDVSEFLSTIPGIHAYNQWSLDAISSAVVMRQCLRVGLEPFEARKFSWKGKEPRSEGLMCRVTQVSKPECFSADGAMYVLDLRLSVLDFASWNMRVKTGDKKNNNNKNKH